MHFRPANPADVEALRAVARRAYVRYIPRVGRRPAPMDADFPRHVAERQATVAEQGGVVIGFVIAYPREDDYFVENVAVDPGHAGKGVGRGLMAEAEKAALAAGRRTVRLYTNVRMYENFAFYAGCGYKKTHEITESGFRRVYLEKELVSA